MENKLKLIAPKGNGYFCDVIQYRNEKTNMDYALKVLKRKHYSNDGYRYRLLREIRLLRLLSDSDSIIDIITMGNDRARKKLWYLMPYAPNNLYKFIKNNSGNLKITDRYLIVDQIIEAIKFAHSKKILHRDISSNNVLVFEDNGTISIKVSDFGLGKDKDSLSYYTKSSVSGYGQILYVSPEQKEKLKSATFKSDIYSLGKLIYFVFTGKDPDNIKPFELSSLVSKATEENPQDRFDDITDFENHYLALKQLKFSNEISIDYTYIKDLIEIKGSINWPHFHQVAVKGNYTNHVYYDYISPILTFLIKNDKIIEYYKAIGSDFKNFALTFSNRIDDCLCIVGWPFSATGDFGKFLKNVVLNVNDSEVRLICLKQLWRLAFIADQWDVQTSIKAVFNKTYITDEIEMQLAEYIQEKAVEVEMSHFVGMDIPKIVKTGIIKSNEKYIEEEEKRQRKYKEDDENLVI